MENGFKNNTTEDNNEFISILDKVLEFLAGSRLDTDQIDILNGAGVMLNNVFASIGIDAPNNLHNAVEMKLKNDGFIEYPNSGFELILRISDKGFEFWKNGGYIQQQTEINDKRIAKAKKRRFFRNTVIWSIIIATLVWLTNLIPILIKLLCPEP